MNASKSLFFSIKSEKNSFEECKAILETSGKSTVMRRVIKELENSDIIFFYYNLREHATYSKEEFLEVFFEKDKTKYVRNNLILDLKVFKIGIKENYDFSKLSLNDIFKKI